MQKIAYLKKSLNNAPKNPLSRAFFSVVSRLVSTSSNAYYTAFQGVATPQTVEIASQDLLSSVSCEVATLAHASEKHDTPAFPLKTLSVHLSRLAL